MRVETTILLPSASVDFFLKDAQTANSARALQQDWRFARVKIRIHEAGVEEALSFYSGANSPDIVLLETETTGEEFTDRLGVLSERCSEGTSAVVIGPVNDVNLYRSLTSMGVSDYLVRPVSEETLGDVIASILLAKLGTSGSRLIAVSGAKGGVGVSSLAYAIALGISEQMEEKTVLIDAAGAWSSQGVLCGYEPAGSLSEVLRAVCVKDRDTVRRMLFNVNEKLSVLATGAEPFLDVPQNIGQYEEILNFFMESYPVVVVDLSSAPISVKKIVLSRAHKIFLVTTPALSALRCARAFIQEIQKTRNTSAGKAVSLLVNMCGMVGGKEASRKDISIALDVEPGAMIPFDTKTFSAIENEGKKISSMKSGQDILSTILPLLSDILSSASSATGTKNSVGTSFNIGTLLGKIKK